MMIEVYSLVSCAFIIFSRMSFVESFQFSEFYSMTQNTSSPAECLAILYEFAESSSNFTRCTVLYSHPIQACVNCVGSYVKVLDAHKQILSAEVNGTKCQDKLINVDRLQIVETTYKSVLDLWERAYCNKCFDGANDTLTISNRTLKFINLHGVVTDCINQHYNSSTNNTDIVCEQCMDKYVQLNSFYESLKDKSNSETVGICMDLVDLMNSTRSIWSGDLDCCRLRKSPEILFLCCTALFTALPILFYVLARFLCDDSSFLPPPEQSRTTTEEEVTFPVPGPSTSIQR